MKEFLSRNAITFIELDATEPPHLDWIRRPDVPNPPVVVIDDVVVDGTDFRGLIDALQSAGLLGAEGPANASDDTDSSDTIDLPATGHLWVATLSQDRLVALSPQLEVIGTLKTAAQPMTPAHDPTTNVLAVTCFDAGQVLLIDLLGGHYLDGTLRSSLRDVAPRTSDVITDASRQRFWVSAWSSDRIVCFDARTGERIREAVVGPHPVAMAMDLAADRLFVKTRAGIVATHAESGEPIGGSLERATIPVGPGRSIVIDQRRHLLFTPTDGDRLAVIDTRSAEPSHMAAKRLVETGSVPFTLLYEHHSETLFVSCLGDRSLRAFDVPSMSWRADEARVGGGARGLTAMAPDQVAVTTFDDSRITVFASDDLREPTASVEVGPGPRGVVYVGPP